LEGKGREGRERGREGRREGGREGGGSVSRTYCGGFRRLCKVSSKFIYPITRRSDRIRESTAAVVA